MESGNAGSEAVHAAVQRGSEQVRHDDTGRIDIHQGAARPDVILSEVLPRGDLRILRDEHKRREHSGLHNVTHRFIIQFLSNPAIGVSSTLNAVLRNCDYSTFGSSVREYLDWRF